MTYIWNIALEFLVDIMLKFGWNSAAQFLQLQQNIKFINKNNLAKYIDNNTQEIKIFASGSETYKSFLIDVLSECQPVEEIKIYLLIREGSSSDENRENKIQEAIGTWKRDIDSKYHVQTDIRGYKFEVMMRGLIIDNEHAFLGWYSRIANNLHSTTEQKTNLSEGQNLPFMLFNKKTKNGKRTLDQAIKTFNTLFDNGTRYDA